MLIKTLCASILPRGPHAANTRGRHWTCLVGNEHTLMHETLALTGSELERWDYPSIQCKGNFTNTQKSKTFVRWLISSLLCSRKPHVNVEGHAVKVVLSELKHTTADTSTWNWRKIKDPHTRQNGLWTYVFHDGYFSVRSSSTRWIHFRSCSLTRYTGIVGIVFYTLTEACCKDGYLIPQRGHNALASNLHAQYLFPGTSLGFLDSLAKSQSHSTWTQLCYPTHPPRQFNTYR